MKHVENEMCEGEKDAWVDDWQLRDYQEFFTCRVAPDSIDTAGLRLGK